MKKLLLASAIVMASTSALAEGLKPLALPGSTWGVLSYPSGTQGADRENLLYQGRIEQGAIWARFGERKEWALNTYIAASYTVDSEGLVYNNYVTPAIGVKMTRYFDNGTVDLGVQGVYQKYFKGSNADGTIVQVYASYWFGWDGARK